MVSCPDALNAASGAVIFQNQGFVWAPTGQAPVAPPPDPAQVAQEAVGQMTVPDPVIHLGPDSTKLAVKVPTWLWVDNPAPMQLTVAVRGLSVTVTAALATTTWSPGEPIKPDQPTAVPSFTCQGSGTPPPAKPDPSIKPPCGYTYVWKSLASRTNGTGKWTVSVTGTWNVTWTASNGTSGSLAAPLTPTAQQAVAIGEWRSALVAGPNG